MKNFSLAFSLMGILSATAMGAGFSLYEGSASGVADTAGAIAKGGSAGDQYYNPATLSATTGTVFQVGSFLICPDLRVESTNPYNGKKTRSKPDSEWWPIPHAYVSHKFSDNFWAGLGLFSRAGLGASWDDDWVGRYSSTHVEIVSFNIAPSVAWRATDWLTLGASVTLQYFDIDLEQCLDAAGIAGLRNYNDPSYSPYDVKQVIQGDDWAWGWSVGAQLQPIDRLHIGLAYHSEVAVKAEGRSKYIVPAPIKAMYPTLFQGSSMDGKLDEPAYFMGSIAYDFTDRLTLGVGTMYSMWSSYDELVINVHDTPPLPGKNKLESEKGWHDVWRFFAGGSYKINDQWTARASFTWDESPINDSHVDYLVPADTRQLYAFGLSYTTGRWTIDGTYFYENINDYTVKGRPADGVYDGRFCDGSAHAFALSFSYQY